MPYTYTRYTASSDLHAYIMTNIKLYTRLTIYNLTAVYLGIGLVIELVPVQRLNHPEYVINLVFLPIAVKSN